LIIVASRVFSEERNLKPRTRAAIRGVLLAAAVLAAAPGFAQEAVRITIAQHRFNPPRITVKAGTTVAWVNADRRSGHAVRSTGPAGFQSPLLMAGQSWAHTFDKPGVYQYACGPHPEMEGTIEVTE
jgi:plastocyanin